VVSLHGVIASCRRHEVEQHLGYRPDQYSQPKHMAQECASVGIKAGSMCEALVTKQEKFALLVAEHYCRGKAFEPH